MGRSRAFAGTRAVAGALVVLAGWVGCGFPEHTFIPDDEFDHPDAAAGSASGGTAGRGGSAGAGGSGGSNAGTGGSVGSGGTGGSGATGGLSGTGGTGANTGGEDCTNGSDDDGDNDVDCADSNCQAVFTCSPELPTGWDGPVALWSGSGSAPECTTSGGFPTLKENANDGVSAQPASCPTCDCSTPSGGTCPQTVDLLFYLTNNCTGAYYTVGLTSGAACQNATLLGGSGGPALSAKFTATVSGAASCTPQPTGTLTLPQPTWATGARACGDAPTTGGGCGTGMCVPKPNAPFGSALCVYQVGDTACPSGPYTNKQLFYKSFTEGRSCTSCACGAASGQTCGSVRTYTDSCAADEVTLVSGVCSTVPADPTRQSNSDTRGQLYTTGAPSGGSCVISGGTPTGSVTAASPITFCCL